MDNIPSEVFSIIFSYLEAKDIYQCLQVCKSWHPQGIQSFWKEVTIYSRRVGELRDYLFEDSDEYFKYGHLTRKMIFEPPKKSYDQLVTSCGLVGNDNEDSDEEESDMEDGDEGESDSEEECEVFSFANVKQLMKYFPNVEEIQIANELYREYLYKFMGVDLKCIKNIRNITNSVIFDYCSYDPYAILCWDYKDTMTCIDFKYTPQSRIKNNEVHSVCQLLSKFTNLTELTFRNDFDPILTTISVQAGCPNLTVLNYQSKLPIIDIVMEKQMEMLPETALYYVNRNINRLYLRLPTFPVNLVKYLIKYLPNKMEKICLDITETNLFSWIDEVSDEIASKFMAKLRNVKNVIIFFSKTDSDYIYSDMKESRMTKYFKLVNALRGDRKPYCTFSTYDTLPDHHSFIYQVNGKLDLKYGLNLAEDFIRREGPRYVGFNYPDTIVSGIGFEIVDVMEFEYSDDGGIDIPYLVFDHILKNCPNMLTFKLVNSESPYSAIRANSHWFKILKTGENGFSDVMLTNIGRYEEIINLLSTYSANVTNFICEHDIEWNYCDRYNTDLTAFTKLGRFTFDLELKDLTKICFLIINFEYTDGEENQFCYHVPTRKITSLKKNFDFGTDITDTMTFKCDKKQIIVLRRGSEYIDGAFTKGELVNIDYPIEEIHLHFPEGY